MAWRAFHFKKIQKEWGMLSIFSASLDLVLTFVFLVSACISILTSKVMRFFQTERLCCERMLDSTAIRINGDIKKTLCNHHYKKLIAVNTIGTDQQSVNVQKLCEDCALLNYYCSDRSSNYKHSVNFAEATKLFFPEKSTNKEACQICLFKNMKIRDYCFPKDVKIKEATISLEEKMRSYSGSADSSNLAVSDRQDFTRLCCFNCEEPRRGNGSRKKSTERMSAKLSLESYEDYFCDSSDIAATRSGKYFPSVQENKKFFEVGPSNRQNEGSKRFRNVDKVKEGFTSHSIGKAGGIYDQYFLHQGDHNPWSTVSGDELSDKGNACPPEFHTHSALNTIVKHDKGFKADSTIKEYQENATMHVDVKKVRQKASEPENTIKDLEEVIKEDRKAVSSLYEELEDQRNASAVAAREMDEEIVFNKNAVTLLQEIPFKRENERFTLGNVESCRSRLLDDKIRLWRQHRLKREELENYYETRRMSLAKRSEKPAFLLEARKENYRSNQSETKQRIQPDSLIGAAATKVNELYVQRVPPKIHREKIWRKLLIIPEMSNEVLSSKMAKEEEKCGETRDMEGRLSKELWSSMFHIKQQHHGTKLTKPCEIPENIPLAFDMRDKEESCSERAYSDSDSSVLGFYFETKGGESLGNCQDLLNPETDYIQTPTESAMEYVDNYITMQQEGDSPGSIASPKIKSKPIEDHDIHVVPWQNS